MVVFGFFDPVLDNFPEEEVGVGVDPGNVASCDARDGKLNWPPYHPDFEVMFVVSTSFWKETDFVLNYFSWLQEASISERL